LASLLGFPAPLLSVLTVALLAALSGGLHLDGLADTADGFLSSRPRARVLEIMRDSHIGVMGVTVLVFVLALKVMSLAELEGALRWRVLVIAPLAGRSLQLVTLSLLPYARSQGGLAAIFLRRRSGLHALWAVGALILAAVLLFGPSGGLAVAGAALLAALLVGGASLSRLGGFTGDTLGATSEIVEMMILVVVAVC
jgi:adenosylcobinamide-GDP ribazoletransferase